MTSQVGDIIFYKGKKYFSDTNPLQQYLEREKKKVDFVAESICFSSGCWRGYIATWEIIDNKLFLTSIKPPFYDPTEDGEATVKLHELFPNQSFNIFASWFTGTLTLPHGKEINHKNYLYYAKYEHEILIEIIEGVVMKITDN